MGDKPNKLAVNRRPDGTFMPGSVPNPDGRPTKDHCVSDQLREILESIDIDEGKTGARVIAETLYGLAKKKKMLAAIAEIINRLEGKPRETVDHTVRGSLEGALRELLDGDDSGNDDTSGESIPTTTEK